jgi:hypothetical protein
MTQSCGISLPLKIQGRAFFCEKRCSKNEIVSIKIRKKLNGKGAGYFYTYIFMLKIFMKNVMHKWNPTSFPLIALLISTTLVLAFFSESIAYAAVTDNGTPSHINITGSSATWTHTVNSGVNRALFVEIATTEAVQATGVTYGGVALTPVLQYTDARRIEIWVLVAPPVGTANVVVSFSGSTGALCGATTFDGVKQSSPVGDQQTKSGTSLLGLTAHVTVASAPGDMVIDVQNWDAVLSLGVGADQTKLWWDSTILMLDITGGSSEKAGAASVDMGTNLEISLHKFVMGAVSINASPTMKISGTVFEDVNYGGGAGRDRSSASGVVRSGARVELYNGSSNYVTYTTSDTSGAYSFSGLTTDAYTVRVVNSSVTSSRSGYVTGLLPVQTYRTDATSGIVAGVTDRVGGEAPDKADAGNGSTTLAALTTATTAPQSVTTISLTESDVTGLDFGFNFDTVVNVNNAGQGSLRQFLTNANALSNSGLAQSGRTAGIENTVWMISNGTGAAGLQAVNNFFSGGIAVISPVSALPTITDPVVLDGSTQPGWVSTQIVKLSGSSGGGSNGLSISGGNSTIKELIIDSFGAAGISLSGTGGTTVSDNIIHANNRGVYDNAAGDLFIRNVIYGNSGEGIYLDSGATGARIYQNTIHGNSTRGISQAGGSATIRNNLITGSGGIGLYSSSGTLTESYNGITDAVTTPANNGGRSNVSLSTYDLNVNPLYTNAATGIFSLTECASPAINQGIDLGTDQPDMNGASAGLWNNNAPEMGAFETTGSCAPGLSIVKQIWELNGTAPYTSLTAPVGSTLSFLIYVKNTTAGTVTDLRINDLLDETAFQYVAGSMVRSSALSPPSDSATDLTIFNATAAGTGAAVSDGVDGDVASAQDTGGLPDIDRITIGAVDGQANAVLSLSGHSTFGLRFNVKIK